ncbi:MAG TPA: hypothetical protein VGO09_05575, partial [Flavisolibacter sp.]|nr:hypothetical protein [Flavisolibacter sp.]
ENYEKWKLLFDQFDQARKSMGSLGGHILKDEQGNNIQVTLKWSYAEKALKFHESQGLHNAMKEAGMSNFFLSVR